jgi:hypothetical protein
MTTYGRACLSLPLLISLFHFPAPAQIVQQEEIQIRHSGMISAPGSEPIMAGMIGLDGRMGVLNVTGKPFSATEVRRTVQMLANGAKLENSDSNQFYRDDQGRTRAEQTVNGRTTIVIMDPVARIVAILDRSAKTVRKTPIPAGAVNGGVAVSGGRVMVRMGSTTTQTVEAHSNSPVAAANHMELRVNQTEKPGARVNAEELGEKMVNGVMAQGKRETRGIPAGSIGNDRELQIVDERWFSNDLQVLIKSTNSDPRFGENSYQLTNIVRAMQDPALFQIPADYTPLTDTMRLEMKSGK